MVEQTHTSRDCKTIYEKTHVTIQERQKVNRSVFVKPHKKFIDQQPCKRLSYISVYESVTPMYEWVSKHKQNKLHYNFNQILKKMENKTSSNFWFCTSIDYFNLFKLRQIDDALNLSLLTSMSFYSKETIMGNYYGFYHPNETDAILKIWHFETSSDSMPYILFEFHQNIWEFLRNNKISRKSSLKSTHPRSQNQNVNTVRKPIDSPLSRDQSKNTTPPKNLSSSSPSYRYFHSPPRNEELIDLTEPSIKNQPKERDSLFLKDNHSELNLKECDPIPNPQSDLTKPSNKHLLDSFLYSPPRSPTYQFHLEYSSPIAQDAIKPPPNQPDGINPSSLLGNIHHTDHLPITDAKIIDSSVSELFLRTPVLEEQSNLFCGKVSLSLYHRKKRSSGWLLSNYHPFQIGKTRKCSLMFSQITRPLLITIKTTNPEAMQFCSVLHSKPIQENSTILTYQVKPNQTIEEKCFYITPIKCLLHTRIIITISEDLSPFPTEENQQKLPHLKESCLYYWDFVTSKNKFESSNKGLKQLERNKTFLLFLLKHQNQLIQPIHCNFGPVETPSH